MAYLLYNRTHENGKWRFTLKGQAYLYGCHVGLVANALREQGLAGEQEPWKWHIQASEVVQQLNAPGDVFVIDLKPNQRRENNEFSFYELLDVWGYSDGGWTPALLRLRGLLVDDFDPTRDCNDFTIDPEKVDEPIFTFVYFSGSIESGEIKGKWLPTGPASSNAVLLWPEVAEYFADTIKGQLPSLG